MTELEAKNNEEQEEGPSKEEIQRSWFENGDWLLRQLIQLVTPNDGEFPVTLLVGGVIVTGQLVSGARHFRGVGEELKNASGDTGVGDALKGMFDTLAQNTYPQYGREPNDKPELGPESFGASYVHLREATFVAHGQRSIPSNRGVWWRGRISSVDAWMLGTLNPTD